jgi:hypothetical protein
MQLQLSLHQQGDVQILIWVILLSDMENGAFTNDVSVNIGITVHTRQCVTMMNLAFPTPVEMTS